jgi:ABC-2 type transport system ATP-binding protein
VDLAIEGIGLEKTFVKKRSPKELVTRPFRKAERIRAVRGVDLQIRRGEIFGLLGPNGAGKTTILKILSCLVLPDRGKARIWGHDTVHASRVKPHIGLVHSDERSFYWRLTGWENLRFFASLYDVPRRTREARIEELLGRVDLLDAADRRFADYSSGMKQRMSIARALLHDPPVLLMDEPTRSLDPASAIALRRFIQDELSGVDAKTVVLATHNLREAEVLCDRMAILVKGRIREVGSVDEVRRWGVQDRRLRLVVSRWPDGLSGPFREIGREPAEGGVRIDLAIGPDQDLNDILGPLFAGGVTVRSCDRVEPDLEEAFSKILEAEPPAGEDRT